MTDQLYIIVVEVGGCSTPMLVPYSDVRCPSTDLDVDHVAVDLAALIEALPEEDEEMPLSFPPSSRSASPSSGDLSNGA